ncbi:MAG: hypothetical protein ACPGVG_08605 [Mycobacterium sp.]
MKANGWRGLTGLGGFLLVVLGAGWLWGRQRPTMSDAEIEKERQKLAFLDGARTVALQRVDETDGVITHLDKQRTEVKRRIVSARAEVGALDDATIEDEFRRLYP